MADDYYKILGVSKDATQDQIKNAYRNLALKYHPDRNKDKQAETHFKTINEAYAVLGDPEKRRQYDTYGPSGFGQRFSQDDIFRGFNMEDVLRDLQQNFGINFDFSGTGFGGPFSETFSRQQEQTGVNLYLSFEDMEHGVDKEFEVKRAKRCDNCKGNGGEPGAKQVKCPTCNGSGSVHVRQSTPFGVFEAVTTCSKCRGRGRTFEKTCSVCKGNGMVTVKERFKVHAETTENKEKKQKWFGVF